jgi:hypothetical protein
LVVIVLAAIVVAVIIAAFARTRTMVDRSWLDNLRRTLADAEEPDRLALYSKRDGDEFDLAAIYRRQDRSGFSVIGGRRSDGARLLEQHEDLEAARDAAIAFARSERQADWVIHGTMLPDIEAAAVYAVNADPDGDFARHWEDRGDDDD